MAFFARRSLSGRAASERPSRVLLALTVAWTSPAFAEDPGAPGRTPQPVTTAETNAHSAASPAAAAEPAQAAPSPAGAQSQEPDSSREEEQAEAATRREEEAKRSGKANLAQRLSALSTRWRAVIQAVRTASKIEAEAAALEQERIEVREKTERTVTLLEQTEARRARALARLQELGLEPSGLPAATQATAGPAQAAPPPAQGAPAPAPTPAAAPKTTGGKP